MASYLLHSWWSVNLLHIGMRFLAVKILLFDICVDSHNYSCSSHTYIPLYINMPMEKFHFASSWICCGKQNIGRHADEYNALTNYLSSGCTCFLIHECYHNVHTTVCALVWSTFLQACNFRFQWLILGTLSSSLPPTHTTTRAASLPGGLKGSHSQQNSPDTSSTGSNTSTSSIGSIQLSRQASDPGVDPSRSSYPHRQTSTPEQHRRSSSSQDPVGVVSHQTAALMSQTQTEVGVSLNMVHHWCVIVLINVCHAMLCNFDVHTTILGLFSSPTLPPSPFSLPHPPRPLLCAQQTAQTMVTFLIWSAPPHTMLPFYTRPGPSFCSTHIMGMFCACVMHVLHWHVCVCMCHACVTCACVTCACVCVCMCCACVVDVLHVHVCVCVHVSWMCVCACVMDVLSMCVCVCACVMDVCVCVHVHVCVCVCVVHVSWMCYMCMCVCACVMDVLCMCMCVCACVMDVCVCMCMCVFCEYVCACMCVYACLYMYVSFPALISCWCDSI